MPYKHWIAFALKKLRTLDPHQPTVQDKVLKKKKKILSEGSFIGQLQKQMSFFTLSFLDHLCNFHRWPVSIFEANSVIPHVKFNLVRCVYHLQNNRLLIIFLSVGVFKWLQMVSSPPLWFPPLPWLPWSSPSHWSSSSMFNVDVVQLVITAMSFWKVANLRKATMYFWC